MWDVIVVGAGPGGSVAAKICAEEGLKTLLLERRELPRDKVCSGILAGETAKNLIREKFGDFPNGVLAYPYYLRGQIVYVQGAEPGIIKQSMPIAWRRDLDYWMTRKAQEQGTEVLESTRRLLAGGAIVKAIRESKKAADIYLAETKGIMELIKILHQLAIKSKFTAKEHPQAIVVGIIEMVEKSLKPIV